MPALSAWWGAPIGRILARPNAIQQVIEPFRPEDDGAALNRLAGWTKTRTELQKILVDNPARLYQF